MNWDGHQTSAKTNKDSVNEPGDEVTPEIEAAINEFIRWRRRESLAMPSRTPTIIDFQPILIPVPPMIEEAFGYTGSSRFVAFFFKTSPAGFSWCDPHESRSSSYGAVWLTFAQHRRVHPFLEHFNLGDGGSDAGQWLLLDRVKRQFLVGVASKVAAFLRSVPYEILSAEIDGTDSEPVDVMQVAMSAMVRSWLDEEDS
jgi:hypothetical protein